jgi:hypothetical protein
MYVLLRLVPTRVATARVGVGSARCLVGTARAVEVAARAGAVVATRAERYHLHWSCGSTDCHWSQRPIARCQVVIGSCFQFEFKITRLNLKTSHF